MKHDPIVQAYTKNEETYSPPVVQAFSKTEETRSSPIVKLYKKNEDAYSSEDKTFREKYVPVKAYTKNEEAYSPEDKPFHEKYVPSALSPSEESSQASSTSMSRDIALQKINRDPRQRNEPVKKSKSNRFGDDELLRRAAEIGIISVDDKDDERASDVGSTITDLDQPPPPGLEEEFDVDLNSRPNLINYPVQMGQAIPYGGFSVGIPHGVSPPVIPHGPVSQHMVPPIVPPPHIQHGPQIPVPTPQPPMGPMGPPLPPPPYPPNFVGPSSVFQQGPPPPPLPPPPAAPPPPPPPPPVVGPFAPSSPSFNPQPLPRRSSDHSGSEPSVSGGGKSKQSGHKVHHMKKGSEKRKLHSSYDEDNEFDKPDMMRKKRRENQSGDFGGTWKREISSGNRDFMGRSGGNNYMRGHRGSGGGFSSRNRSRGFEPRGGRGNYFRGYPHHSRGYQSGAPPGSVQSEWDEEIRHFEQNRERRHKKIDKDRHWNRGGSKGKKRNYSPDHDG